jgi:hypothetical protein
MKTEHQLEEELRETAYILYCKYHDLPVGTSSLLEYSKMPSVLRKSWIRLAAYGRKRYLDAVKEGMRRAATKHCAGWVLASDAYKSIFSSTEALTEKDL